MNEGSEGHVCVNGRGGPSGFTLASPDVQKQALARILRQRFVCGKCEVAMQDDFVVMVRLGDVVPAFHDIVRAFDSRLEHTSAGIRRTIVLSGILHFGGYSYGNFISEKAVNASISMVKKIQAHYIRRGFKIRLRSNPDADADLCYIVFAPHVAVAGRGFGGLVEDLRRITFTQLGNTTCGH